MASAQLPPDQFGLRFVDIAAQRPAAWARPEGFFFFRELPILPIAESECLHLAHYAPIAIRMDEQGPEVVVVVHPDITRAPLIATNGQWAAPYPPMALRALPFRTNPIGQTIEFCAALSPKSSPRFKLYDNNDIPTKDFAFVLDLLKKVDVGAALLRETAKILIIADILTPLVMPDGYNDVSLYSVSRLRLSSLTPRQGAALSAFGNRAFELAAAALFSQRWLTNDTLAALNAEKEVPMPAPPASARLGETFDPRSLDGAAAASAHGLDGHVLMDADDMFSIDAFLAHCGSERPDEL